MRFSFWPRATQPWPAIVEAVAHAEAGGWDGVWIADHFMPLAEPLDVPTLECWSVLGGLAATVPRVRIGSLVSGNTYRHPAVLANIAASVDQLSGGRVVLGLGAGWQANEHAAYGIDFSDVAGRLARLDEACAVIRQLLDEPRGHFEGRFYRLADAPMEPKAAGRRMPLLIGGAGERVTLRIAARWADEWNTWGMPDVLAAKGAVLDEHCARLGRDPATIARSAQVLVDLDGASPLPSGRTPGVAVTTDGMQQLLGAYEEAGVDEFILPDWNLGTGAARLEVLDRFIEDVAPPFRGR